MPTSALEEVASAVIYAARELVRERLQLLPTIYMSRAANWLTAAAEADRRAAASAKRLELDSLRKLVAQESNNNLFSFIRGAYKLNDEVYRPIAEGIRKSARSAGSSVRRALRRAHFLAIVHWIVPRAAYIIWSLLFLVIVVDEFVHFGTEKLARLLGPIAALLAPYVHAEPEQITYGSKLVLLIVVGWWLVERLRPFLERWQAKLQRREVEKFASDVINAKFQIRICRSLAHIAFFDAQSFAFQDPPERFPRPVLKWRVPKIEELDRLRLAPLNLL